MKENILELRFAFNVVVLVTGLRRLPEFAGYTARPFPGQMPPRRQIVTPRRADLPQSFDTEWQRIKTIRSMKREGGRVPRKIFVLPVNSLV